MAELYGIPNCDTVKKARRWLDAKGIDYAFCDFKKGVLNNKLAEEWLDVIGIDTLLNKRGTTWRALPDATKDSVGKNKKQTAKLLVENPTLIKRPVLKWKKHYHVGFSDQLYSDLFQ
jgi:arsenate reductase